MGFRNAVLGVTSIGMIGLAVCFVFDPAGLVTREPFFFLAPAVVLLGLAMAGDAIRARRKDGLCPTCGYDLRGTPARCPECGAVPPPPPPSA